MRAASAWVVILTAAGAGSMSAAGDPSRSDKPEPAVVPRSVAPREDPDPSALIDRAVAELAALSASGVETSVYFGVLSSQERQQALQTADRMIGLLDDAARRADETVMRLEEGMMGAAAANPDAARRAQEAEAALSRLVDVEQAQRIPFYRAVAQSISACTLEGAARAEAARAAVNRLSALTMPGASGDAARRLMLVAALMSGPTIDDRVRAAIVPELDRLEAAAGLDAPTRERVNLARLVLASAFEAAPGPTVTHSTPQAEAVARGLIMHARLNPATRNPLTARACQILLASSAGELAADSDAAARLRTYAKISAIIEPGVDTGVLPAEAVFARAVTLLREHPDSLEARALLEQVERRSDVPPSLQPAVLWELAAIATRDEGPQADDRAIELLDRFIRTYPTDRRAATAARSLESLCARLLTVDSGLPAGRKAELARLRLHALDTLIAGGEGTAEDRSQWRARWLIIRLGDLDPATVTTDALQPLIDVAAKIDRTHTPATSPAIADLFARMIVEPAWSVRPASQRVALIALMRQARGVRLDPTLPLLAGEALLQAESDGAAEELRPLLGGELDESDRPTRARLRLALAAALRDSSAGRVEAIGVLRELTAALDAAPSSTPRPVFYWQSWALTLELFQMDNNDGRKSEAIRAQAKRLELLDPGLGGPETAEQIRRVRDAAAAK